MSNSLILLTNDDGFFSQGIKSLFNALNPHFDVYIVAPDRERSATSMSLTLHNPLRVHNVSEKIFSVSGTPVDCVYMAVQRILPRKPSLLISGINHGPNLGQQDISYSGTMGGALQGTYLGIPSFAVSIMPDSFKTFNFEDAAEFSRMFSVRTLEKGLPEGITININIPASPIKGIKAAKLGQKRYNPEITKNIDPRGRLYYWIGTGRPKALGDEESDVILIKKKFITITPVNKNVTDFNFLQSPDFSNIFTDIPIPEE